jgi:hypothetical protein
MVAFPKRRSRHPEPAERNMIYLGCSLIAMKTKNPRFQASFAVIGSLYELFYFLRQFFTVG